MNRRIDFTQLGGFPISQNSLAFLQQSFRDAFAGLAAYFGDYVILSGVADLGANYGDGWMAINGELVPFVGGTKASNVVITESVASKLFADGNTKNVWYTRTASCASSGGTPFTSFTRLSGAKNDQLNLTAEVNARTNGDTTLQTNINNEIAARANGDTILQNNINNLIDTNRSWISAGALASGWTGSIDYKLTGRGTVKFRGVVTKSSPTSGEIIITVPVAARPSSNITHAMGNFNLPSSLTTFLFLNSSGQFSVYQSQVSSGGLSAITLNLISFPEFEI